MGFVDNLAKLAQQAAEGVTATHVSELTDAHRAAAFSIKTVV